MSASVVGVRQPGSTSESPVYDVPFGSVQLASSSKVGSGPGSGAGAGPFDLASGFAASADFENQEEEDDDEADDDDGDSEDGKGKGKKGKRARSEAKGERDLKTGRRKIKIEFIEDDARRHITFSKRKAGIMKKAYELATLTGTQVLLLVVSQTGLVYTFTTPKLQALVTQAEGRNLIQACLNAPDPPNGGGESDGQDQSGDEGSDVDDGASPSESQASSNKRVAQTRKRPRTNSASKSSSAASTSAAVADDDGAPGSQIATAKRGRGRPRKNTAGGGTTGPSSAPANLTAADPTHPPMPPPAMHQSYSDDVVHHHHHHQQQHNPHHHQQQQHQPPQYTHVPSTDFPNYAPPNDFFADTCSTSTANPHAHAQDLGFAQQGSMSVDTNQATPWNQSLSPSNNHQNNAHSLFAHDAHHPHQHQHQQHQQHQSAQFNYAPTQHFSQFNPQLSAMQPQEIQAPRPAW